MFVTKKQSEKFIPLIRLERHFLSFVSSFPDPSLLPLDLHGISETGGDLKITYCKRDYLGNKACIEE